MLKLSTANLLLGLIMRGYVKLKAVQTVWNNSHVIPKPAKSTGTSFYFVIYGIFHLEIKCKLNVFLSFLPREFKFLPWYWTCQRFSHRLTALSPTGDPQHTPHAHILTPSPQPWNDINYNDDQGSTWCWKVSMVTEPARVSQTRMYTARTSREKKT